MESYQSKSITTESYFIRKYYCSKCIYFIDRECTKEKIYKKCFNNNERVLNNDNM